MKTVMVLVASVIACYLAIEGQSWGWIPGVVFTCCVAFAVLALTGVRRAVEYLDQ